MCTCVFILFNKIEMCLRQEERKVPLKTYTLLALTTVATMGFSNASLGYLNYPTQVPEDSQTHQCRNGNVNVNL